MSMDMSGWERRRKNGERNKNLLLYDGGGDQGDVVDDDDLVKANSCGFTILSSSFSFSARSVKTEGGSHYCHSTVGCVHSGCRKVNP